MKKKPITPAKFRYLKIGLGLLAAILIGLNARLSDQRDGSRQAEPTVATESASTIGTKQGNLPAVPSGRTEYVGKVISVPDGDTVRFRAGSRELRIRIDSIDAPEQDGGRDRPGQRHAQVSQANLARLVNGKTLTARCYERDQYQREVCALLDEKGESIGRVQVRAGLALAYTAAKGRYLRDAALVDLQREATDAKRGVWQDGQVIPPWVWRYDCWREKQCVN